MSMTTELTMEKMEEIRLRYSPKPIPKCRICGAEMSIGAVSASRTVYACSGATHDENGWQYAPGRSLADDHYSESRVTVVDVSDPDVLALVETLEARDKQIAEDVQIKARLCRESNSLFDRLRAAEKRIAELEAKLAVPVKLPKTNGYWTDQEKAFEEGITLAKRQIRLAGFRCEGDE